MAWILVIILCTLIALALMTIRELTSLLISPPEPEPLRAEIETRSAELRLHDLARESFVAMLNEARSGRRSTQ